MNQLQYRKNKYLYNSMAYINDILFMHEDNLQLFKILLIIEKNYS